MPRVGANVAGRKLPYRGSCGRMDPARSFPSLTLRITETNMPFKRADIRFTLDERGESTVVTVSPEYKLKFGFLGSHSGMGEPPRL